MELTKKTFALAAFLACLAHFPVASEDSEIMEKDISKVLSRKRRYLSFPEGASFSMAICMTVGVLGQPSVGIYTWGLNWGIAYDLPNQNSTIEVLTKLNKVPHPLVARRFRRDLYSKLELIMNDMGYSGRECIYRALCEASQRLMPTGGSLVEELFKKVFSLPSSEVLSSEPIDHHLYDSAQRNGKAKMDCQRKYRMCPVSLLDLALGYYTPSFGTKKITK
ncbi:uncharacterized protein LOC143914040 [Arctopsyche grandis]|uniref:uncharacterized protein LOC143914040 n=1 Tax=Arctopsyche grandis TaxID=121162 RepID=UPI00406D729F